LAALEEEQNRIDSTLPVSLRPTVADDESFLYTLYCSTRSEEMAAWGWHPQQQEMFLKMQYRAQQHHYRSLTEGVDQQIILLEQQPIGRLIVSRSDAKFSLDDIALLPERRGKGIGAALIEGLLAEARQANRPVTLHVEKYNRAARLYARLGFKVIGDIGIHFKMEWRPDTIDNLGEVKS
jgi:ribosomal protein S18 acetylase RimI-like enzyme